MADKTRVSIHESGHALMAVALGLDLFRVQMHPPRFDLMDEPRPDQRIVHVLTLMAGCEAERVIFDNMVGGGTDDTRIERLLRVGDDEAAMREAVFRFLDRNAGTLRYLASRLLRRGSLTGEEVERIVRNAKQATL